MKKEDESVFIELTELFYHSDSVLQPISKKHHIGTFNEIMRSNIYLEGYIIESDNKPAGYAITAKTYSHEAGGIQLWIDEIYIMDEFRGKGLGKEFFDYIEFETGDSFVRLRLEVEPDNRQAKRFFGKMGFEVLQYQQMFKDISQEDESR